MQSIHKIALAAAQVNAVATLTLAADSCRGAAQAHAWEPARCGRHGVYADASELRPVLICAQPISCCPYLRGDGRDPPQLLDAMTTSDRHSIQGATQSLVSRAHRQSAAAHACVMAAITPCGCWVLPGCAGACLGACVAGAGGLELASFSHTWHRSHQSGCKRQDTPSSSSLLLAGLNMHDVHQPALDEWQAIAWLKQLCQQSKCRFQGTAHDALPPVW